MKHMFLVVGLCLTLLSHTPQAAASDFLKSSGGIGLQTGALVGLIMGVIKAAKMCLLLKAREAQLAQDISAVKNLTMGSSYRLITRCFLWNTVTMENKESILNELLAEQARNNVEFSSPLFIISMRIARSMCIGACTGCIGVGVLNAINKLEYDYVKKNGPIDGDQEWHVWWKSWVGESYENITSAARGNAMLWTFLLS